MSNQTMGKMIATLRKKKGMTQLELAELMGVSDKAVSKWERDVSFPDITSTPKLAEVLGLSVEELMLIDTPHKEKNKLKELLDTILKAIAVAMGIAVVVLSILEEIEVRQSLILLGIGLSCLAISQLKNNC